MESWQIGNRRPEGSRAASESRDTAQSSVLQQSHMRDVNEEAGASENEQM